ncbi:MULTISPECIES: thiamine pyrophosphate-binding protein [unclassified Clostridium]|uniref:thiamine pyrophosphate-binding protein n=1 Tax=unclassified Clostridium TaxID=2614128 RepID=UPI000E549FDA|nr:MULTISPECIES: thiamine pyrophosphate-binding protein [unclassified Clostridium]RHS90452.1 thiamine pyrophosphate-binding protein [Clostridium sp. AM42-4]RHV87818.1 thiamine pyrophosphate-binding protein [Clostridium sp. OF09-36]
MKIKVSNYIAGKLVEAGINQVFTVTGGGAMHLNDALGHQEGLHCLYQHHEQACAIAAEAYARIHNKIGALCVTTGPGGTNAITGVVGGWLDSIPMLVLSGQVRYDTTARWSGVGIRAMGDQEFDIVKSIDCMTKYSEMVIDPLRIRYCLEKAIYLSYSGRPGPTWLDIPLDVQGAYVDTDDLVGFDAADYEAGGTGWAEPSPAHAIPEDYAGKGEHRQVLPKPVSKELAREIIEKIRNAKRPVLYAGNGIRIAGAFDAFMEVADGLGIPAVVGWNANDCMYDDCPWYVGRPGNMGDRPGNLAVQNSDLVFSVGSRLSIRQVGYNYKTWAREAYVIMNDVDPEELKKPSVHVDMPVHADAKDLMETMAAVLREEYDKKPVFDGGEGLPGMTWSETCRMYREKYPTIRKEQLKADPTREANVYAVVEALSSRLSEDQITVVGNGSACVVGGHAYIMKKGQRFLSNSAIASMGYDLPAAIGACMAAHDPEFEGDGYSQHDIILLTGEGSIQMNLQELQTIIHHKMPVKIFLINNGGYHSIRQTQRNFFGEPLVGIGVDSHDLSFPDMAKLAPAYGYPYVAAYHNEELADAVEKTLAMEGPVICELFVTTDQNFEPKSSAKRLPDGTLVSPPLEDLSPFLPDEEMDKLMIIPRIK